MPRKSVQSVHQIGLSTQAQKKLENRRRTTPKSARKEVAVADAFIDNLEKGILDTVTGLPIAPAGPEEPAKAPRSPRKSTEYTFTPEELRQAREGGRGRSWANVAKLLGLPNPGAARKAWADVIGEPHTEARTLVGRATKGASSAAKLVTPKWDASADGDEVIAALAGAQIMVRSALYGNETVETMNVAFVTEYDESGDEPVVTFTEGVLLKGKGEHLLNDKVSTGATRTVAISRIVEVR